MTKNTITTRGKSDAPKQGDRVRSVSLPNLVTFYMKKELDALKAELRELGMVNEQLRKVAVLIQSVNALKVVHTAKMADLVWAHTIQIKELHKQEIISINIISRSLLLDHKVSRLTQDRIQFSL